MAANTAKAYKDTYQIIQMMCSLSDSVPVKWRRWLWEKALDTATDLIALIVYAYDEKNLQTKLTYIDKCLTKFTVLNTYLRLSNENAIIPTQKFVNISELMADISQQLSAWRKGTADRLKGV